jgi:hypothetical protein
VLQPGWSFLLFGSSSTFDGGSNFLLLFLFLLFGGLVELVLVLLEDGVLERSLK